MKSKNAANDTENMKKKNAIMSSTQVFMSSLKCLQKQRRCQCHRNALCSHCKSIVSPVSFCGLFLSLQPWSHRYHWQAETSSQMSSAWKVQIYQGPQIDVKQHYVSSTPSHILPCQYCQSHDLYGKVSKSPFISEGITLSLIHI